MTSTAADQITGFSGSLAVKQPVRLATLVDIVLEGLIAIDGIVPAEGDRVLVKAQATPSQNGIYIASTGVWSRAADFDATGKAVKGTQVWVTDGTTQAGTLWIVSAANPIVIDTSALTWQAGNAYQAGAAMAAAIIAATSKSTPVAADRIGYVNSVDNSLVQMTWAQMMAALLPGAAASSFVRRNAGNTAYEHRSAAQVLSDIAALPLAGGTLTGSLLLDDTTDVAAAPPLAFDGDANTGIGHPGADRLAFITAGVQRAEFTAAGALDLLSGQMKFPATANPSSDANTLDDYEEGTWTPALTFGGAAVGMTATAQTLGRYTKIGNMVAVYFRHQLSAKGSSTGTAVIGGLPFTSNNFSGGPQYSIATGQIDAATFASLVAGFDMAIGSGGTSISLRNRSTTGQSGAMSEANFTNSSGFGGSGVYMV